MSGKSISVDIATSKWRLREQMDYRDAVGVNPQFAMLEIIQRVSAVDEDGQVANEAYNIPPEYLVGLVWITLRRQRPDLTFDEAIDEVGSYDELVEGFRLAWQVLVKAAAEAAADDVRRPTKAGGRKSAQARETPSSQTTE